MRKFGARVLTARMNGSNQSQRERARVKNNPPFAYAAGRGEMILIYLKPIPLTIPRIFALKLLIAPAQRMAGAGCIAPNHLRNNGPDEY